MNNIVLNNDDCKTQLKSLLETQLRAARKDDKKADSDSKKLAKELRSKGYGVTVINGEGMEGEVTISWCVTPRKKVKDVLKIVSTISPDAYITTESTNPTKLTANRK